MKIGVKIFAVLLIIGIGMTVYFFANLDTSQTGFYEKAVENVKSESYRGIVTKKFVDKYNRGREKVVLDSNSTEIDLVYEKPGLFEFIQVGDTLEKKKNSLEIRIRRKKLDTLVLLKFGRITGG